MSSLDEGTIFSELATIVSRYSGKSRFTGDAMIYADLGVNGSDFIELIEEVETRYAVDLNEISPREPGARARDVSTRQLAAIIAAQLAKPQQPPL